MKLGLHGETRWWNDLALLPIRLLDDLHDIVHPAYVRHGPPSDPHHNPRARYLHEPILHQVNNFCEMNRIGKYSKLNNYEYIESAQSRIRYIKVVEI